jgi:hypothetical protein
MSWLYKINFKIKHKLYIVLRLAPCSPKRKMFGACLGHMACMEEKRNAYRILVGNSEGK